MRTENIRSYAIGRTSRGLELHADITWNIGKFGRQWVVKIGDAEYMPDENRYRSLYDTLPDAIEAGKAYLLANGGEVYPDGDEGLKYIRELEGECESKDKRIEELEWLLRKIANHSQCFGLYKTWIRKALEVKQ